MSRRGVAGRRPRDRQWSGFPVLEIVRRLNGQCVDFLLQLSRSHERQRPFMCLSNNAQLWAQMNSEMAARIATCPMLLLDIHFDCYEWWEPSKIFTSRHFVADSADAVVVPHAGPLAHEILMEAWIAARDLPRVASLAFGMTPAVTGAIAQLRASDLHPVASAFANEVRPRWDSHPRFWTDLLTAAHQNDIEALVRLSLQCLQLLGSSLPLRSDLGPLSSTGRKSQ